MPNRSAHASKTRLGGVEAPRCVPDLGTPMQARYPHTAPLMPALPAHNHHHTLLLQAASWPTCLLLGRESCIQSCSLGVREEPRGDGGHLGMPQVCDGLL